MNFNKVFLAGNLTRDPETRYTPNGTAITVFGLAVNRRYKSEGEYKSESNFFDVEVWKKQAENCSQYLSKGSGVLLEGYLKQDRWEDHNTGDKRSKVKIVATNVQFMTKKQDDAGKNDEQEGQEQSMTTHFPEDTNGIPF